MIGAGAWDAPIAVLVSVSVTITLPAARGGAK